MKAPLLFAALIMSVAVSAVYSLTLLDNIVHGTLYNYGLQFSYDWATPYWTILRATQALMGLSAVFALSFTIYVYRKYVYAKPQIESNVREEVVSSSVTEPKIEPVVHEEQVSSTNEPHIEPIVRQEVVSSSVAEPQIEPAVREEQVSSSEPQPQSVCGLVKCAHCGNTFSQSLRSLDFSADKPRIVDVCPSCNQEIKPVIHQGELKRVEKAVHKKKRKGKAKVVRKSREALQEQPKDETKEMVTVQAC